MSKASLGSARKRRHLRVRKKIQGTAAAPRLCLFRSNRNLFVQLIDDSKGITLVSASTLDKGYSGSKGKNKEAAYELGKVIGAKALERDLKRIVFDRSGYLYHGKVAEIARGAREAGLEF